MLRSGQAIAVMSSKGGVGKTTLSLGLAETLACAGVPSILLVDADPQGSVTGMMDLENDAPSRDRATLAGLLEAALEPQNAAMLEKRVAALAGSGGSDVDDAERVDILPVGSGLIALERRLTRENREAELGRAVGILLDAARETYDVIIVDCAPGLYLTTESWLRLCDFQVAPIKADKISLTALDLVFDFRRNGHHERLSKWLGIVVNGYQDNEHERTLLQKIRLFHDLQMFESIVPATLALQRVSIKHGDKRSYHAKYPGASGAALRQLGSELLQRISLKADEP